MRRSFWASILCAALLFLAPAVHAEEAPALPARAYLLMDATTGQVLHAYAGDTRLPMASTTKIMTAILALEKGRLTDVVTAGRKPYDTGGTTIYLEIGEKQTLENLLYALMLESANDAGVAIAEHLGGTEEQFASWMNEKAAAIGARNTHFVNSHGLHHPDHYSTARDLALIARYAMQNPAFRALVQVEERTIPGFGSNAPRRLYNRNRLLGYYEGANGVKNGFTEEALLTNVASARRGDTELIAVVLGAENRVWTSSMALLDFGFSHFRTERIVQRGDVVGRARVPAGGELEAVAAADLSVTVRIAGAAPERRLVWRQDLQAPIAAGDRLGELQVVQSGEVLGAVDLLAAGALSAVTAVAAQAPAPVPAPTGSWPAGLGLMLLIAGAGAMLTLSLNAARSAVRSGFRRQ